MIHYTLSCESGVPPQPILSRILAGVFEYDQSFAPRFRSRSRHRIEYGDIDIAIDGIGNGLE